MSSPAPIDQQVEALIETLDVDPFSGTCDHEDVRELLSRLLTAREEKAEREFVAQIIDQWFIQGGKAQFGDLYPGYSRNADTVVAEILSRVRAAVAIQLARSVPPEPEHDNHHNAATCPYCNPERERLIEEVRVLRQQGHETTAQLTALEAENIILRKREPRMDEMCVCGKNWGQHSGHFCEYKGLPTFKLAIPSPTI